MVELVHLVRCTRSGLLPMADLAKVVDSLVGGGLAILPTETGYMLAAVATNQKAVETAFRVKRRDLNRPMHIACSSVRMIEHFSDLDLLATRIIGELMPGPVTVVTRSRSTLPDRLVTLNQTVGIRMPDCPLTLQVIDAVGLPLTATSLNETGSPSLQVEDEDLRTLAWPSGGVVFVVRGDQFIVETAPSTLVRTNEGQLEILRPGPISELTLQEVAGRTGYLEAAG